jgi:hypothetical protein
LGEKGVSAGEPAYYARTGTRERDFRALLHPPYTAWNVSHVLIGAALAPRVDLLALGIVALAFVAGTGVASHALDELKGRPLGTGFTDAELKQFAAAGFGAAFLLALLGVWVISPWLLAVAAVAVLLVCAYTLEWWGGAVHTDLGFAATWGGFPVLVGYWSQTLTLSLGALLAAAAATLLSLAQRSLSTNARFVRRHTETAQAVFRCPEGERTWDKPTLLRTWEKPLRLLAWTVVLLALALLLARR